MSPREEPEVPTEPVSNEGGAVPAVPRERWQRAQEWELAFWNRQNVPAPLWKRMIRPLLVALGLRPPKQLTAFDDRNHWWKAQFDGYRQIPLKLDRVCELGCGPYTNVRLFLEGRTVEYVHCSDPLAKEYIGYPNAWLASAHRRGTVSVAFHTAEDCPYRSDYFDCVILINVLDHVMDAHRCLAEALRITRPGGYFVFGQDLTEAGGKTPANPGHPIVLDHQALVPTLDAGCEPVFHHLVPRELVAQPDLHYGALAYVGRKRSPPSEPPPRSGDS
jgi:SAM-dependent methyltransferase